MSRWTRLSMLLLVMNILAFGLRPAQATPFWQHNHGLLNGGSPGDQLDMFLKTGDSISFSGLPSPWVVNQISSGHVEAFGGTTVPDDFVVTGNFSGNTFAFDFFSLVDGVPTFGLRLTYDNPSNTIGFTYLDPKVYNQDLGPAASIPEPSSFWLMFTGLLGFAGVCQRMRRGLPRSYHLHP